MQGFRQFAAFELFVVGRTKQLFGSSFVPGEIFGGHHLMVAGGSIEIAV